MTRTMKSLERKWIVAYKVHEQGKLCHSFKTPIHASKIGVLGISLKSAKGTSLRESASFGPSRVKIRRRPVGEFPRKGFNK